MRRVLVDDDVYALLVGHVQPAGGTVNDVLRRLLLGDLRWLPVRAAALARTGVGDLMPFLTAGLIATGDELRYDQPRKQLVHRGTVTASGCVIAGDQIFRKLSPALSALVGHEASGWSHWRHTPSGRRLQDLRDELRRRPVHRLAAPAFKSVPVAAVGELLSPPTGAAGGWAVGNPGELDEVGPLLRAARAMALEDRAQRSRRAHATPPVPQRPPDPHTR